MTDIEFDPDRLVQRLGVHSRKQKGRRKMTSEEVFVPLSETDQLKQQLLHAQRLSSVGALASSVAHEFNNILTTIINYAKMGLRSQDDSVRSQAFEKILHAGQRAANIINSMLGYARNQSSQREWVDLAALVEDALLLTEKDLSKHHIRVQTRFESRPQALVVRNQIEQILLNLIINARQAMPNGGELSVHVRENSETSMAEIRISDTGVGIPPKQMRRIFEPFFSTKQPDEHGHGGNGLGLSVCRQIIEQHHGRIRVESVVGKGSTFTVKLPMKPLAAEN
ncbi:MAG: two-component sensor histidine kinase [Gemmatales bacterium]|nr:MAG: two-component sensor histidine kinase [Gemmatales bacterium]